MTKGIRIGDVVAVSAKVKGIRGDGSYIIEPMGFDFEATQPSCSYCGSENEQEIDVDFSTIDEPKLLKHTWMKGDRFISPRATPAIYERPLGDGLHLLNLPEEPQHHHSAWAVLTSFEVDALTPEEPPQSD